MNRVLVLALVLVCPVPLGRAAPYWVGYEGEDYPENEGWTRITFGGGAERYLDDGCLMIGSRGSVNIADFYQLDLPGQVDPEAGELFIMRWRVRIDEVIGPYDLSVGVFSDEHWAAAFNLNEDTILSTFESGVSAGFEAGVFHDFELRSCDMRDYELFIDDVLAIEGSFWDSLVTSRVGWGDGVQGGASLAHWGYVEFGVVPDVSPLCALVVVGATWLACTRAFR